MKYVDEFRNAERAKAIIEKIALTGGREIHIMEICGTHTHSVSKHGLRGALPHNIKLLSGPGCPVCVTHQTDIDKIIDFSNEKQGVIITTFGDMLRVPGNFSTLEKQRASGADIRIVYSPLGALGIARENPDKEVIFFSVGFETTAPTIASTVKIARRDNVKNFSVLSLNKLTPPAMKALLDGGEVRIDGFICPGHVTAIIGAKAYGFIASEYFAPCVVSGFEPLDILMSVYMLIEQINSGKYNIEIEYKRVVTWDGNVKARAIMEEVFEKADTRWRGLGFIKESGLKIKQEYSAFDAEKKFDMTTSDNNEELKGCLCAQVLKGMITPVQCPLFGNVCTPLMPKGPCMVSSEGTCAAYYMYEQGGTHA